jgi:drug/metabolite transporter (DMT)-like permease
MKMIAITRHQRGLLLAIASVACSGLVGALAKYYGDRYNSSQLLFLRNTVGFLLLMPVLWARGGPSIIQTKRLGVHLRRGLLGGASLGLSFYLYHRLPLGTAMALTMTYPCFVALCSGWYLKQPMPKKLWWLLAVGFVGVLLVSQPKIHNGDWWLYPLALFNAFLWALARLTIRDLASTENPITIVFYCFLVGGIFALILLLLLPGQWHPLMRADIAGLLLFCAIGVFAQLLITSALEILPAWQMGPLEYGLLLWAVLFDWWWWGQAPTLVGLAGGALIAVVGIRLLRQSHAGPPKVNVG